MHLLYALGIILLCIGSLTFFHSAERDPADLLNLLPAGISFGFGMLIGVINPEQLGWFSQVDPLTMLFLIISVGFSLFGTMLLLIGQSKSGELLLQISAALISFLGGLEAGMIRQRAKEQAKKSG